MGLGEFLSARSEKDLYHSIRDKELFEIHNNPEMERRETIEILSDKGMTPEDANGMANILERVLGRPFRRNVWSVPYLLDELKKDPSHHIKKYRAVFAQGKGVAWPKAGTFNARQSIAATTAEQWAEKHIKGK